MAVLLQIDGLTPVQRAVKEQFQKGGSVGTALLVVAGLAALAFVAYRLSGRPGGSERQLARPDDAIRLFRTLLSKLNLSEAQCNYLHSVTNDHGLKNPAKVLLSPALFDKYTERWTAERVRAEQGSPESTHHGVMTLTRAVLFPTI